MLRKRICEFTLIMVLVTFTLATKGQGNFNVVAGIGLPELTHVGLRYNKDQGQIGLSVGQLSQLRLLAVSADLQLHFAGSSKHIDRKPW